MASIRTFIDSGVLIAAARGNEEASGIAMEILEDPDRVFITSDFVRLEILPKCVYQGKRDEADFYNMFFEGAKKTIESSHHLVKQAQSEAEKAGLSALDALHVAAALAGKADELVTKEKPTKPFFRVRGLRVTSIHK